ncbi:MAG: hypothetical protein ACM34K_16390 [Bacillota bacterium]
MSLLVSVSIFAFSTLTIGMGVHVVCKMVDLLALPLKIAVQAKNNSK